MSKSKGKRNAPARAITRPAPDAPKIEKGVPMEDFPTVRTTKYPWDEMEVGDSFEVEIEGAKNRRAKQASIPASGNSWARRKGLERLFKARVTEAGVRVWRVK